MWSVGRKWSDTETQTLTGVYNDLFPPQQNNIVSPISADILYIYYIEIRQHQMWINPLFKIDPRKCLKSTASSCKELRHQQEPMSTELRADRKCLKMIIKLSNKAGLTSEVTAVLLFSTTGSSFSEVWTFSLCASTINYFISTKSWRKHLIEENFRRLETLCAVSFGQWASLMTS